MREIELIYLLDLFGTAVFAVTGCLRVRRKGMDVLGVVIVALVTALGGGTLRDLILGIRPVFWATDPNYVYVVTGAAVFTQVVARYVRFPQRVLLVADAVGLAVFTVLGLETALRAGSPLVIAVMMAVTSAVVGGLVRDLLAGEIPLILQREVYATASLMGAGVYVVLMSMGMGRDGLVLAGAAVTFGLRMAALRWRLSLPRFEVGW